MSEIEEYIEFICSILEIPAIPSHAITLKAMQKKAGPDAKACYDREENMIYVVKKKEYELEDFYHLSHEIRHAWQNYKDPDYYFDDYLQGMDEATYNSTNAEIDANAFAAIAMAIAFEKVVTRNYKDDPVAAEKYNQRLNELMEEYGVSF